MRTGLVTVLGAALAGCVGSEASETVEGKALALLDREAREAGFSFAGRGAASALPRAIDPGELVLQGPGGERVLEATAGELLVVTGLEGRVERLAIGREVHADRVVVDAPEGVVLAIVDETGAETVPRPDGRVELVGPDLLAWTATLAELDEVAEVAAVRVAARPEPLRPSSARTAPLPQRALGAPARAPATALEPPAAIELALARAVADASGVSCSDPVAGTWVSQRHFPGDGDWYVFTLQMARTGSSALQGEIFAHSWTGDAERKAPISCEPSGSEWVVRMPARGEVREGQVRFEGTGWAVDREMCGRAPGPGAYNLDRFSGLLPSGSTGAITWSNDDGGRMRGEPFEFRRVSCR